MSEFDKGKFSGRKKFNSGDKTTFGRSFFNSKTSNKYEREQRDGEKGEKAKNIKQPTILLKSREQQETRPRSPKIPKENETSQITIASTPNKEDSNVFSAEKEMRESVKLLQDGIILSENLQEFLQENNDFLVIGIVGKQAVGKSTIMNLLVQSEVTKEIKKESFSIKNSNAASEDSHLETKNTKHARVFKNDHSTSKIENNGNVTNGIDFFITDNRIMFLDCQPFGSAAILEDLVQNENKRLNVISDFLLLENSEEIQSLQMLAFLLSVCHVVILVQDYFFDINVVRLFLSAEMLKPTIANPEDEYVDHFPHLILLHNKAQISEFSPSNLHKIENMYNILFSKSKCHINSKLSFKPSNNSKISNNLLNLFLIPEVDENSDIIYKGHSTFEDLIKKLRSNMLGSTKYPLTHVQLTEKNWLVYCVKVWDHVKKSNFFVEYNKLLL